jgi:hypothetical protein
VHLNIIVQRELRNFYISTANITSQQNIKSQPICHILLIFFKTFQNKFLHYNIANGHRLIKISNDVHKSPNFIKKK